METLTITGFMNLLARRCSTDLLESLASELEEAAYEIAMEIEGTQSGFKVPHQLRHDARRIDEMLNILYLRSEQQRG